MVLTNLKEYKYRIIKRFSLHRLKKGWEIVIKKPGKRLADGSYKIGQLFFDYTSEDIKISNITKNLLRKEFIRKV